MNIKVKQLGALKQAEFSLGDLTIICGGNNSGKTYATYALYGFLSFWREAFKIQIPDSVVNELLKTGVTSIDIDDFIQQADSIILDGCHAYTRQLPQVFASAQDKFKDTTFELKIDKSEISRDIPFNRRVNAANAELFSLKKEAGNNNLIVTLLVGHEKAKIPASAIKDVIGNAIKEVVFGDVFPRPFIASAERTGAAIFRKELNFARNRLLSEMAQTDKAIDPLELLFKAYKDYALPVKANVDFTRQLESLAKDESWLQKNNPGIITDFSDIIGGDYTVTRNDELYFVPKGKRIKLTMDESSSAVRSMLDIGFYLKHMASPGDLLIIDEPELNLHPANQRRVARLFTRLVNAGIKVFITTHSDYIIKELNTLILLHQKTERLRALALRENYKDDELINPDSIKVFIAEETLIKCDGDSKRTKCQTLVPADISSAEGIEARSFDETINDMNRIQDEIVWGED